MILSIIIVGLALFLAVALAEIALALIKIAWNLLCLPFALARLAWDSIPRRHA